MSPLRFARRRLLARTALCGVASAAFLAAAPARAQVGVSGLKLANGAALSTSGIIQIANSSCGGRPSCDGFLFVTAVGTAALPQTDITTEDSRVIIRWSQFDIGYTGPAGFETVQFNFNARDDIVINIVNSPTLTASQIDGVLVGMAPQDFNLGPGGNIWIINPAGVVFGANSVVETGGLLATTAQLTNQAAFLAGGDTTPFDFAGAPAGSEIEVEGRITGYGGALAFVAPVVATAATALVQGAKSPVGCSIAINPCGTDVLYGAAGAFTITFAPNADNDLDLFSWIVPAGGETASTTPVTLAGTTRAGNVYIAAVNEADVVGAVVAPGAITATMAGGANGDIVLSAGGGLRNTAGVVTPVASAGIGTTSAVFDGPLSADGGINLVTNGDFNLISTATALTGDIDITAAGGANGADATLSAPAGAIDVTAASFNLGTVTALGNVTLTGAEAGAASTVNNAATSTDGSLTIASGGDFDAADAVFQSGADMTISTGDNINVAGATFQSGGGMTFTAGANIYAPGGAFQSGADMTFTAVGPLDATGATMNAGSNLSATTASFDIGSATAGGTLTLTGTGGGANSIASSAAAAGDVAITGGGALDADAAMISSSGGAVAVDAASFDIGSANGFGPVTLTASGAGANVIEETATSATGNLLITAGGSLQATNATLAAREGGVSVNVASFVIGTVDGLDTVTLTGTGVGVSGIEQSATSRTGDLDIVVGGPLDAADASFTSLAGNVVASAGPNGTADPAFPLTIGQVTAGNTMTLQAGAVTLGEASSAGSWIYVRTGALDLGGTLTSDAYITIASTAGNLNLGDNVFNAPAGLDIGNATFNQLVAPIGWVALYAGDPGDSLLGQAGLARGDLTIGTLGVNAGAAPSLYLFADGDHTVAFTGPVTNTEAFGAMLTVGGAPPPSIATATADWTPGQVLIEAQGAESGGPAGSIGTPDSPFYSVTFNALDDVIMGTPGFITAVDQTSGGAINVLGGSPPVPASAAAANGAILLATDTLTLLANGKIVQQNTSAGDGFSGLVVEGSVEFPTALTLGCVSCTATSPPTVIDLFGTIANGQGETVTGRAVALSSEIELQPPLAVDLQYRANGCVIKLAGVCGPINLVPIIPVITELPPTNTIETLLTIFPEPPLLEIGDYQGQADVTIIGSGNEEIWRTTDSDKCTSNPASTNCPRR